MTLEEIKAQHPGAEVINTKEITAVHAVYEFLESIQFEPTDVPDDGIIINSDGVEAYFVSAVALSSACFEPQEVGDWLYENQYIDTGEAFLTLGDNSWGLFLDLVAETDDYDTAVSELMAGDNDIDYTTFDYFQTPYGDAWEAQHAYWLNEIAERVDSAVIVYELD